MLVPISILVSLVPSEGMFNASLLIVPTVILGVPDKPVAVMPSALISD